MAAATVKKGKSRKAKKKAAAGKKKSVKSGGKKSGMVDEREKIKKKAGRKPKDVRENGLDRREVISLVCRLHCQGNKPEVIRDIVWKKYKVYLSRQAPYSILERAGLNGELNYTPPTHLALQEKIMDRYGDRLDRTDVIHTAAVDDVTNQCAALLSRLMNEKTARTRRKTEINIGLSGGPTMRKVAKAFAKLLHVKMKRSPKEIVFWALTAAFERDNPANNPSAFFTYFQGDPLMRSEIGFHCLPHSDEVYAKKTRSDMEPKLDFIVTSCSEYDDQHSVFRKHMNITKDDMYLLQEKIIIGDIMLLPFGKDGPYDSEDLPRAETLFKLEDFPGLIDKGTKIILVLAPCGECGRTKHELLHAGLNQDEPYFTHLVVDSKTAFEFDQYDTERARRARQPD